MEKINTQIGLIDDYLDKLGWKMRKFGNEPKKLERLKRQFQILSSARLTLKSIRDAPDIKLLERIEKLDDTRKAILDFFNQAEALREELRITKLELNKLKRKELNNEQKNPNSKKL